MVLSVDLALCSVEVMPHLAAAIQMVALVVGRTKFLQCFSQAALVFPAVSSVASHTLVQVLVRTISMLKKVRLHV
jgi:hypothetical protein